MVFGRSGSKKRNERTPTIRVLRDRAVTLPTRAVTMISGLDRDEDPATQSRVLVACNRTVKALQSPSREGTPVPRPISIPLGDVPASCFAEVSVRMSD